MRGLFNYDGPVFTALNKLTDLIILNLLFIVCCIPIFTIGASCTAMAYVTQKQKDGREGYIWKSFFHSFKQNFFQATIIWMCMLALAVFMLIDMQIVKNMAGNSAAVLKIFLIAGAVIWFMIFNVVFPLLAKFDNKTLATVKNAALIAVANAPKTILLCAAWVAAVFITAWNTQTIATLSLVWLLIGFAAMSVLNTHLFYPIFLKLIPEELREDADTDGLSELDLDTAAEDSEADAQAAEDVFDYTKLRN